MPAGLDERVCALEKEVRDLKAKVGDLEHEWQNIPDLIDARLKLTDSRVAKLTSDMRELRAEVREVPRAIIEMLDERDRRKREG